MLVTADEVSVYSDHQIARLQTLLPVLRGQLVDAKAEIEARMPQ